MAKWKKEEVRVWRLKRRVVAGYPGDKWAAWPNGGIGECVILGTTPYDWDTDLAEDVGTAYFIDIRACRNGEMDEYFDSEFGPESPKKREWQPGDTVDPGGWALLRRRDDGKWETKQQQAEDKYNGLVSGAALDAFYKLRPASSPPGDGGPAEPAQPVDSKITYGSKKSEPFRRALTEVWRVSLHGQAKHGANNWQSAQADGMHFYEDALWRHLQDRRMGEVKAPDSGCYHLAHLAWNALMLLEMELRGVTNPEWGVGADDD